MDIKGASTNLSGKLVREGQINQARALPHTLQQDIFDELS